MEFSLRARRLWQARLLKHRFDRCSVRGVHHLDAKWLQKWSNASTSQEAAASRRKTDLKHYYQLPMFPYPSGRLHIGHLRVYTISDTLARFKRMCGFNVVHPIGWDAFGLPAENAAIEHGINASDWTYRHINIMREQIKRMMISFDWEKEIITCSPEYYKQTQRIFLELYKAGLAYRKKSEVNWDPIDKTVLANEQIDSQGRSWRSGAVAQKRVLEQWFLKITAFAKELDQDLKILEDWPDMVKRMQHQWIGLSEGVEVKFSSELWAFTTKIETLYGVKFVAIAEDHPLAKKHAATINTNGLVEALEAIHPLTGDPVPVYVAPYVISGYGSGVVMGVPAHDDRDRAFWNEVRAKRVLADDFKPVVEGDQVISGPYKGMVIDTARAKLNQTLSELGSGRPVNHMRLRDWLVSRQRFWGAPVPMIHCESCGVVPVPESQLPVELPKNTRNVPLSQNKEWLETKCPNCGGPAHRDPDTMDTFMDSSWYFFRYLDSKSHDAPFEADKVNGVLPVDCYVGGVEHAILHLLYARFVAKFLAKIGKWDGGDLNGEPFRKLVTQGMVHGKTFRDRKTGRYMKPEELRKLRDELHRNPSCMDHLEESMEKMSKSKFNGVDPLQVIERHGADATRAHMLFQAPVAETLDWDDAAIVGVERWLTKLSALGAQLSATAEPKPATNEDVARWNQACDLVQSITASLDSSVSLNTVISDYMKFTRAVTNLFETNPGLASQAYEVLLKVIAPVCPATADELWQRWRGSDWTSVHDEAWPKMERMSVQQDIWKYRVVIDSKPMKTSLEARDNASIDELLTKLNLEHADLKKVIYKPNIKLLSVVTK